MKKKIAIFSLFAAFACGVLALASLINSSRMNDRFVSTSSYYEDEFVLDTSTKSLDESDYIIDTIDVKGNVVRTLFSGITFSNNDVVLQRNSKSSFKNIDPFNKGISGVSVNISFEDSTESPSYLVMFFSYYDLTLEDIYAGKHADLVTDINEIHSGGTYSISSEDCPDILSTRYVYGLIVNGNGSLDFTLTNLSIKTKCAAIVAPPKAGDIDYDSFQEDYESIVESFGYTYFTDTFFIGNGAFEFNCSQYSNGYGFSTFQNMTNVSGIMGSLESNGFATTLQQQISTNQFGVAIQKQIDENLTYSYMLTITLVGVSNGSFAYINIYCTTQYSYMGGGGEWPTQDLVNAGASEGLINAFNELSLSDASYTFAGSESDVFTSRFMVMVNISDPTDLVDDLESYLSAYKTNPNYTVNDYDEQGFVIKKNGTSYSFTFQVMGNMGMAMLQEYKQYNHLPLEEFATHYKIERLPTDFSLNGNFEKAYPNYGNLFIGRNVLDNDVQAFVDYFVSEKGYSFAGSIRKGELIENPTEFVEDLISISISKVDTNIFEICFDYEESAKETTLRKYLCENVSAYQYVDNITGEDNLEFLETTFDSFYIGTGEYHCHILGLDGGDSNTEASVLALFNNVDFETTQMDTHFYRVMITKEDYDDHDALYIEFIQKEGGIFIKFGLNDYGSILDKTYAQVNAALSGTYGDNYIELKSGKYSLSGSHISSMGLVSEMSDLYAEFKEEVENNGHYTYNAKHDIYLDTVNNVELRFRITKYNTGFCSFYAEYSEIRQAYDEYDTYEASGIDELPLMANFPGLPQLEGERVYKIISASATEVKIEYNEEFDFQNYYHEKGEGAGFTNQRKRIGTTIYTWSKDDALHQSTTNIMTFKAIKIQSPENFMNLITATVTEDQLSFVQSLQLSNPYTFSLEYYANEINRGVLVFRVYGTTVNGMRDYLNNLTPSRSDYYSYVFNGYEYSLYLDSAETDIVKITIRWDAIEGLMTLQSLMETFNNPEYNDHLSFINSLQLSDQWEYIFDSGDPYSGVQLVVYANDLDRDAFLEYFANLDPERIEDEQYVIGDYRYSFYVDVIEFKMIGAVLLRIYWYPAN